MIPFFHLRGYPGVDPLDHVSQTVRTVVPIVVTAVISTALVYALDPGLRLVQFVSIWMMIAEVVGYSLFVGFVSVSIRKSSSIVQSVLILIPIFLLEFYLQSHVREEGGNALWVYYPGTFIDAIRFLPLRFFLTIGFDAVLIGPGCLWLSRLLVTMFRTGEENKEWELARKKLETPVPSAPEWGDEIVPKPARSRQFRVLRLLGIGYLIYLLFLFVGAFGASSWPEQVRNLFDTVFANPFTGVSTFSKIGFMIVLAFTAAYNPRIRWHATLVLLVGHLMSVVMSLIFYLVGEAPPAQHQFLLISAIVDVVMVALFAWIMITSSADRYRMEQELTFPSTFSLPAQLMRMGFLFVGILAVALTAAILLVRFYGDRSTAIGAIFGSPDPALSNAITMYSVIALLGFLMVGLSRLRDFLMQVLLFGFMLTIVTGVPWLLFSEAVVREAGEPEVNVTPWFVGNLVLTAVIYGALVGLRKMKYDVDYSITSFNPSSARSVLAMHDAIFGHPKETNPDEIERSSDVLQSIDRYVGTIRGRKRGLLNFPYWMVENLFNVLFGLRPSFSTMSTEERKYFLRRYLIRRPEERRRACMPELADFARDMSTAAHAILMFATYSQLKRHRLIGYVPPGARDRLQSDCVDTPPPFTRVADLPVDHNSPENWKRTSAASCRIPAPRVSTPVDEPAIPSEVDFVVIGSGPGGAVMAYRLAQSHPGASILIVERGARYSPLQDFNDREMEMMPKLYKEGGLQQTKRADMFVLQGECVGGGSVINNAICYPMPKHVERIWSGEYGINLAGLDAEYRKIAEELNITPLSQAGINKRMEERFVRGVNGYNRTLSDGQLNLVSASLANASGGIGDGLWNIGNHYLRKRSVLETYIPWAEARGMIGGKGDERVRVVSNTSAVQFFSDRGRATAVQLQVGTGELKKVTVRRAVVVACGVISSSHFLMRSGVRKNVGLRMSCNFAFPFLFEVDEIIRGFDGEQITMGATTPGKGMIFETYFNPPSAFALSVPLYFDRLDSLMRSYERLLNFGVLVGSEPRGIIERKADLVNGQAFSWSLGARDRDNIRFALATLLRIGVHAGARRAVLPMQPGVDLDLSANGGKAAEDFIKRLMEYPFSMSDMLLSTAHPQGGNLMASSTSPEYDKAVVDETFRVKGYDNVFVADASLFPTGVDINPQWTIMAMSSLASKEVM